MSGDSGGDERDRTAEEDEVGQKLRLGQHRDLFPDLFELVKAEPLRERRSRQLMLALYRCGRLITALEEYHRLRESLSNVGLEPSIESSELELAIAMQRPELESIDPSAIGC